MSLVDPNPISSTFTRKILYCKRCGSRVVSNVVHCPYCGKNLLPYYKRLIFWIIIVLLMGTAVVVLVVLTPATRPNDERAETPAPIVVGAPEGASIKDLPIGATVDCNSLLVTVLETSQELTASDGTSIIKVTSQFLNKNISDVTVYSTQWQLETSEGERIDRYIGKTSEGETIKSDLESKALAKDEAFTAVLYFSSISAAKVIFVPDALSYNESNFATWLIPQPAPEPTGEDFSDAQ